jgi:AcrR family transcriptional regulator
MPRVGLNRERVVAEAAAVADEVGLDRLTLAAVAERFGVALPSLYKHVDGLDGLRRDLAVLGVRELTRALSKATVGRSGGDALRALADAYRAYAHAHPGRYAASVRAPDPDDVEHTAASAELLDIAFAVLAGYGVTGDDAVDAIRGLRAAMHGYVTLESASGFKMAQDVDVSYQRLIDALGIAFAEWGSTGHDEKASPSTIAPRSSHS